VVVCPLASPQVQLSISAGNECPMCPYCFRLEQLLEWRDGTYAEKMPVEYTTPFVRQETQQETRDPNVASVCDNAFDFATPLAFNAPDKVVPWDDLRKILHGGQRRMAKIQNGEEILPKVSTP